MAALDLGMGNNHQHKVGGTFMQHIWFTPNDITQAFSDTEEGSARAAYDIVNGVTAGGAPMK